jgi:hypothetical protein
VLQLMLLDLEPTAGQGAGQTSKHIFRHKALDREGNYRQNLG